MLQPDDKRLKIVGFNAQGDLGPITFYTSSRNKLVAFAKSPPLSPPSRVQQQMRDFFRLAAAAWRALPLAARAEWATLAAGGKTRCTGFNLFLYYQRTKDRATIETLQRLAHVQVL
jgi:hypothetical protein